MDRHEENLPRRKPFKTRLAASFLIWFASAALLGVGWFFTWILPARSGLELRGAELPEPAETRLAEGVIFDDGHYLSRRQEYYRPRAVFAVNGQEYRIEAVGGYAVERLPAFPQQGSRTEIVYLESDPGRAWFRWEYDRMRSEYASLSAGSVGDAIRRNYEAAATVAATALGLFLLTNLFVPIMRPFGALVKTRR